MTTPTAAQAANDRLIAADAELTAARRAYPAHTPEANKAYQARIADARAELDAAADALFALFLRDTVSSAGEAREAAIQWQTRTESRALSYEEIAEHQALFEELGEKFGLAEEFRENGIC